MYFVRECSFLGPTLRSMIWLCLKTTPSYNIFFVHNRGGVQGENWMTNWYFYQLLMHLICQKRSLAAYKCTLNVVVSPPGGSASVLAKPVSQCDGCLGLQHIADSELRKYVSSTMHCCSRTECIRLFTFHPSNVHRNSSDLPGRYEAGDIARTYAYIVHYVVLHWGDPVPSRRFI